MNSDESFSIADNGLRKLERLFKNFDILGEGVTVEGAIHFGGYSVEGQRQRLGGATDAGQIPTPSPIVGACCFTSGGCLVTDYPICSSYSGFYHGDGTTCSPNPCPQPGACCYPGGTCYDNVSATNCASGGGTFFGEHSTCAGHSCCGGKTFAVRVVGLSCVSLNGSDHVSIFDVSSTISFPATTDLYGCCEAVMSGSGFGTNLGIDLFINVFVTDTGGGTYSLTFVGTLSDTNGSSTPFTFGKTYSGQTCGYGGTDNFHPTRSCGNSGPLGPGFRCSSGYCDADGHDYLWLLTEIGGGVSVYWA